MMKLFIIVRIIVRTEVSVLTNANIQYALLLHLPVCYGCHGVAVRQLGHRIESLERIRLN